jgi:predicted permease
LSTRAFRALLALYPGEFRDEYGREVAMVFADRYQDATGIRQRVAVWMEALAGVLKEAPKEHVHMLIQDLRYALRMARRSPAFSVTAIVTLALGIGANTAIFQLIDEVGLRRLPVERPGELAEVRIVGGNKGFGVNPTHYGNLTRPIWDELKAHQEAFSGVFAWTSSTARVGERSDLRRASAISVSGDFFRVLGIQPSRGRLLDARDESATCPASTAVVSHSYWQRELGGREPGPDTRLRLDGALYEIVGVTPPDFFGLAVGETFMVALPFCTPKEVRRERFNVSVIGRLRPGWTLDRASSHLFSLSPGIFEATYPADYHPDGIKLFKGFRLGAYSVATGVSSLRDEYHGVLTMLLVITGLVLVIACANLANLMLARASARDREVAVRLAMGASRIRLMRQFLAESALLAIFGAAIAVGLAQLLSRVLVWAISTTNSSPTLSLTTNWRVLLFSAATAGATCIVFGLAPALRARRVVPAAVLKAGGRGSTAGRERFSTQRAMVVVQIATSVVLLVAAFLFVRSFYNMMTFDPGLRQSGLTVAFVGFGQMGIPVDRTDEYRREVLAEIQSIPGVIAAGTTTNIPLFGGSWGHGVRVGETDGSSRFTWVSPGYFSAMNIPILEGRDFARSDLRTSPHVAIVNQSFVRKFVGKDNPIGRRLRTRAEPNFPSTEYEIVGVIPDTKYSSLRGDVTPIAFGPDTQYPPPDAWWANVMIHSSVDSAALGTTIKRRLAKTHPAVISEYVGFQSTIRERLVRERVLALLSGFFGLLAALLAMVGLYGMIAFAVNARRQEIGVRVALGATRGQVIGIMMREAAMLLGIGLALGVALALPASRGAASILFGIAPDDLSTLAAACLLLIAVAAVASFLPARTASRLDPLTALRQD